MKGVGKYMEKQFSGFSFLPILNKIVMSSVVMFVKLKAWKGLQMYDILKDSETKEPKKKKLSNKDEEKNMSSHNYLTEDMVFHGL